MIDRQIDPASSGREPSISNGQTTSVKDGKKEKGKKRVTRNPLVVGIASAIVAGLFSFWITHSQDQDAANQARAAQQVQAADQLTTQRRQAAKELETATNGLFLSAQNVYSFQLDCVGTRNTWKDCASQALQVFPNYNVDLTVFNTAISNIADSEAVALANQFANESTDTIIAASSTADAQRSWSRMVTTYTELIGRCGQLVQGQ
jgi:type II secretory pathway pseudopilin PulG